MVKKVRRHVSQDRPTAAGADTKNFLLPNKLVLHLKFKATNTCFNSNTMFKKKITV